VREPKEGLLGRQPWSTARQSALTLHSGRWLTPVPPPKEHCAQACPHTCAPAPLTAAGTCGSPCARARVRVRVCVRECVHVCVTYAPYRFTQQMARHSPPKVPALIVRHARKVLKEKGWQRLAQAATRKARDLHGWGKKLAPRRSGWQARARALRRTSCLHAGCGEHAAACAQGATRVLGVRVPRQVDCVELDVRQVVEQVR